MKIISIDSFNRESVADRLVAENVRHEQEAQIMVDALNAARGGELDPNWFVVKPDDYKLWRGMEELV